MAKAREQQFIVYKCTIAADTDHVFFKKDFSHAGSRFFLSHLLPLHSLNISLSTCPLLFSCCRCAYSSSALLLSKPLLFNPIGFVRTLLKPLLLPTLPPKLSILPSHPRSASQFSPPACPLPLSHQMGGRQAVGLNGRERGEDNKGKSWRAEPWRRVFCFLSGHGQPGAAPHRVPVAQPVGHGWGPQPDGVLPHFDSEGLPSCSYGLQ